jgi:hypothetical protein
MRAAQAGCDPEHRHRFAVEVTTWDSDAIKQITQADLQSRGNLFDVNQGQIPHAALDAAVVGAVKPTSFRSFFLVDLLLFSQTPNSAAKADADVGRHGLPLLSVASDPYTADESHLAGRCSRFRNQNATLHTMQAISPIGMRGCSDFVTEDCRPRDLVRLRVWCPSLTKEEFAMSSQRGDSQRSLWCARSSQLSRPTRHLGLRLSFIFLLLFVAAESLAQSMSGTVNGETSTPIPGVGHDYIHLLSETIDPSSGSVNLRIDFPTAKSRGLTLPLGISYSTAGLFRMASYFGGTGNVALLPGCPVTSAAPYPNFAHPSCGWTYSYPQSQVFYTSNTVYGVDGLLEGTKDTYTNFTFSDPSGVSHNLHTGYQCMHYTSGSTSCGEHNNVGDPQVTATLSTGGNILDSYTIKDHDGTTYTFLGEYPIIWPSEIEDRNGNTIYPTYTSNGSTQTLAFPDTAGRTGYSISWSGTGAYDTVQAAGLTYKVYWRTMAAPSYSVPAYSFFSGDTCHVIGTFSVASNTTNFTMNVVSAIVLPNGLQYTLYYGDNNPDSTLRNPYGLLSEILYPNGAFVKYTYRLSDTYSLGGDF